ncbi:MAG: aminotransferase class V-fold PLP-dependent enzyme [Acidobacteriota bacterium]
MHQTKNVSRRNFFQQMAGSAAAVIAGLSMVESTFAEVLETIKKLDPPDGEAWHFDGGYWAKVREQFMLEEGFGYLNNGTLGPTPTPVYEAMVEHWRLMAINPHENSQILQDRQENLRFKAAQFLDVSPDEVAITRNTTEGNTILCHGLDDLKQGDEILISAFEHNSCKQTWLREAKRRGYQVKEVSYNNPPNGPDEILNAFDEAITSRTRIIHIANPTGGYGCIQPVKELAELAHSKNILFFIDGAHAPGMFRFSLREWDVDAFACNAHKWLCGPAGSGLLYVRQNLQDRIWPNISILARNPGGARKYSYSVGRRPWPAVAALSNTLDFHLAIGRERTERRLRALGSYLREEAAKIAKVEVYTSNDPKLSAGISRIGIEGVSGRKLAQYLRQRYDVYIPGGSTSVRFSSNYYNTFEQVDRVLQGLKELALGAA